MIRICVVIVHGHGRDLLGACLSHLLASRDVEVDVVVVANACDDGLPDVAIESAQVSIVESEQALGFSEANNIGVRWASQHLRAPDFFFFLNDDAFVEPASLYELSESVSENPEVGIVGPRLMIWGARDHLNSLGINVTVVAEAWDEGIGIRLGDYGPLPASRGVLAVTGAALMIRAGVLAALGGWESLYGYYYEDIDLCLRAHALGYGVWNCPEAIVWHAISATADRASKFKLQLTWRNRLLLLLIHWPWSLLFKSGFSLAISEARVLVSRLRVRAFEDAQVQLRAWLGAIRRLWSALRLRRANGRNRDWVGLLRPAGTVPVIQLPERSSEGVR